MSNIFTIYEARTLLGDGHVSMLIITLNYVISLHYYDMSVSVVSVIKNTYVCLIIDVYYLIVTVLKGISDGLSRGKKPDEMEKLVKFWIC